MKSFSDYLKETHLSAKQKKIAAIAGDKDKIDADDLAALRAGKKPVEEAKKCMDEDDMDESGLRMAAHAAHKSGKKEFEFQGKTYPVKVQKEEVELTEDADKDWHDKNDSWKEHHKHISNSYTDYFDKDKRAKHLEKAKKIEHKVRTKHGDKVADDMVKHSDAVVGSFDGPDGGRSEYYRAKAYRNRHNIHDHDQYEHNPDEHGHIKEEIEQIDEAKYGIDVHRNKLSKLLTHASNAGIKAKVVSHNPNWEKQNAGGEHVVHLHGKDEHVRKFIQKHHDNDPQATDDYKEYGKSVKEEVEQIDELSKKTLGSYVNKAAKDSRIHGQIATDFENTADKARKQSKRDSFERLNRKYLEKAWKREDGIAKAVGKLTKEEVQLDEGKMKDIYTSMMHHADKKGYSSHKQFTPADYDAVGKEHGISGKELAVIAGHKTAQQVANEAVDTVEKDASGKVKSWSHEGDWKKSTSNKEGSGRAANLAGQALKKTQQLSKEEVERIEEKLSQLDELSKKTLGSYAHKATDDAQDKAHDAYDDGTPTRHELEVQGGKNNKGEYGYKPLQNRLTGIARAAKKLGDKDISKDVEKSVAHHLKQRYHWDNMDNRRAAISDNAARGQSGKAHEKIRKASGVDEEVSQEMSPYVKGTLAVMDEGKIDDLRDAQKLRKATQSAYSKGYKPDTSHPHIQVVKGTAYGGANQKDDEGDEKKDDEGQEKRGRGRPAGKVGKYKARGSKSVDKDIDDREFTLHLPK